MNKNVTFKLILENSFSKFDAKLTKDVDDILIHRDTTSFTLSKLKQTMSRPMSVV